MGLQETTRALADPIRRTILNLLKNGPLTAGDINDHFEEEVFGETNGYELVFENNLEEGHYVFGDINPDLDLETDTDIDGYVTLLEIDFLSLPHDNMLRFGELGISDGRYIFLIKEEDLENLDFSNVKFIDKED